MFTDAELDYLTSQRLGRLATAQPDGTLQVNLVGLRMAATGCWPSAATIVRKANVSGRTIPDLLECQLPTPASAVMSNR